MFRKLRGKLKEYDIDQVYLAEKLDVCQMAISHRMTGKTEWRLNEMYFIMDLIEEPYSKLHVYFPKKGVDIDNIQERTEGKSCAGDDKWTCPFMKVIAVNKI